MEFKKFYADFGKIFPVGVTKRACDYCTQSFDVATALNKAIALYAVDKRKRPLRYEGYTLSNSRDGLIVYKLQTETISGLRHLSPYTWEHTRNLAIAQIGENCLCTPVAECENQPGIVWGGYEHNNRYAVLIKLSHDNGLFFRQEQKSFEEIANLLAKNAVAWYPEYLKAQTSVSFAEFLLDCPIRFAEFVNETIERTSTLVGKMSVGEYLAKLNRIKLADVQVFGF